MSEPTRLTGEGTEEVLTELAAPAEDTPERRALFDRMRSGKPVPVVDFVWPQWREAKED